MKKIYILIILLFYFGFLVVQPVSAIETYIGLLVNQAQAPGCVQGTNLCGPGKTAIVNGETVVVSQNPEWCLSQYTELYIYNGNTLINKDLTDPYYADNLEGYFPLAGSSYITKPSSPVCSGDIIWTGLFRLIDGVEYKLTTNTKDFCPGFAISSSYCFVPGEASRNCCEVCGSYGLTAKRGNSSHYEINGGSCEASDRCYDYIKSYNSNSSYVASGTIMDRMVEMMAKKDSNLTGLTGCTEEDTVGTYSYFDSTGKCFIRDPASSYTDCVVSAADRYRVCDCNFSSDNATFNFTFTP